MNRRGWVLIAAILVLVLCVPALAAGNGETTYRALLLGVDGDQTGPAGSCVNDTNRMSQTLQAANEAGSFYQAPVLRANLQADEILDLSSELETWNVDEDDVTFFYYAGAGYMSDKGTPGIVGKDNRMVRMSELIGMLDTIPGTKMVALDMRYSDAIMRQQNGDDADAQKVIAEFDQAVLDTFRQSANAGNYYVLTAATLSIAQSSEEEDDQAIPAADVAGDTEAFGTVTRLLAEGCGYDCGNNRPADRLPADVNENGAVSLIEAGDYVLDGLSDMARQDETLIADVAISPEGSTYPLLARRASSEVLEVTFQNDNVQIPVGKTCQLEAVTQPPNASKRTIAWTSSDLSVVTVNDDGVVSGLKPGKARIAATTVNGLTVFADVTVKDIRPVESLRLNATRLTIGKDAVTQIGLNVEPADANEGIHWSSDNSAVATVDDEGNMTCVGEGDAIITVESDGGISALCAVKVVDPSKVVKKIETQSDHYEMYAGESEVVTYRITPANAEDPSVMFVSDNPNVADVSGESIIIAVAPGECVIHATASSGVSTPINVKVNPPQLFLNKKALNLKHGAAAKIQAKVRPDSSSGEIIWESSDSEIATVENGTVTAIKAGEAVVTARLESGIQAECKVTVDGVSVKKLAVKPNKAQLEVGATAQLECAIAPENATVKDINWVSSDEKVASVDENGLVTAKGVGTAAIVAQAHNDVKAKCLIKVKAIPVSSVTMSQTEAELVADVEGLNTLQLVCETEPAAAGNGSLKWKSSNPKVASVNSAGEVTAKSAGKAIIRAYAGKGKKAVKADCTVTVIGNGAKYEEPVVGAEPLVYTSAKRILYSKGYLGIEMYFTNKTDETVTVPQAGILMLTLEDGSTYEVTTIETGNAKVKPNASITHMYKVKVKKDSPLYGLNLHNATAQIVADVGAIPEMPAEAQDSEVEEETTDNMED